LRVHDLSIPNLSMFRSRGDSNEKEGNSRRTDAGESYRGVNLRTAVDLHHKTHEWEQEEDH
jgi:hypothetical protein